MNHTVYNRQFGFICLSMLFFSTSFNMLIPELPKYLSSLGGAEYKGLIISLFTLTAGISRPFSGKLSDLIGRVPVIIIGAIVCILCGVLYPLLSSVTAFLCLRLLHGFSTGFTPTGASAMVADIIPETHRGEAIGIQGLAYTLGFAIGPAIGSSIKLVYSYDVLFYISALFAFLSMIVTINLKESLATTQKFTLNTLKITKNDIISLDALPSAIVMFLSYMPLGVILTLIPDWTSHLGFQNKGVFFIFYTVSSISIRFIAGKASDRYGRIPIIYIGLIMVILSLLCIGYYQMDYGIYIGATLYGFAMGILSPAINAWTVDLSPKEERGKGIATMFIALEAGIGIGAFTSGWYYSNQIQHFPQILYSASAIVFLAVLYLLYRHKRHRNIN